MYIEMEMLWAIEMYIRRKKKLTHNVDKFLKALNALQYKTFMQKMHTHTHTHTHEIFTIFEIFICEDIIFG